MLASSRLIRRRHLSVLPALGLPTGCPAERSTGNSRRADRQLRRAGEQRTGRALLGILPCPPPSRPRHRRTDPRPAPLGRLDAASRRSTRGSSPSPTRGCFADLGRLRALYDERRRAAATPTDPVTVDGASKPVVDATNARAWSRSGCIGAYLYSFIVATDATDDDASAAQARSSSRRPTDLGQADQAVRGVGRRPSTLDRRSTADQLTTAEHAFPLERAGGASRHQMSEAEEDLAADLRLSGSAAWARLHRDITSRLTAPVRADADGTDSRVDDSRSRWCAAWPPHTDRDVRREAYHAELAAWETVAVPLAAALNGAKGETVVLNRRRGWTDALEPGAVHQQRRPRDARRHAATRWRLAPRLPPLPARQAAAAARRRQDGGLAWYDLLAPVGRGDGQATTFDWSRGRRARATLVRHLLARARRTGRAGLRRPMDRRRAPRRARSAARSACRCATASRGCCSTSTARSTACRRWPTSSATPITTPRSPSARRCNGRRRWRWPRRRASSARRSWSRPGSGRASRRRAPRHPRHRPAGRHPGRRRHPQSLPVRVASCADGASGSTLVGRRAQRADARRPGAVLRRRPRSRPAPPVHVGGEGPLLHAVLQLAVHVRSALRHRAVRAVPRRSRSLPAGLRRPAVVDRPRRRRHLGRPLRHRRAVRRVLGRRASTSSAAGSTSSSRWSTAPPPRAEGAPAPQPPAPARPSCDRR